MKDRLLPQRKDPVTAGDQSLIVRVGDTQGLGKGFCVGRGVSDDDVCSLAAQGLCNGTAHIAAADKTVFHNILLTAHGHCHGSHTYK